MVSYNQPKLNAYASWSANAITFSTNSTTGEQPYGIFIDTNNTVYVADRANNQIQVWFNDSIDPTRIISGNLSNPYSLFVTITGDIYVDNGDANGRVDEWAWNINFSVPAMYVGNKCMGLFVDINDILYCSLHDLHQVVAKPLNNDSNTTKIVAGTGCNGSSSNALSYPYGVYVDINLDLYVAECGNNRIQLFQSGKLDGTTIAGAGSLHTTVTLSCPTDIVLDADGYLFIVDSNSHRIFGSGPNGFRCLVGCSGGGSASNQLQYPRSLSFDSYGNIFVTDSSNSRIQKFILLNNTLGK